MRAGCGAVSLSSFGGEGQGEEAVVLREQARYIGAATRWNAAPNRTIENSGGPPLPNPLLQRRRGRTTRPLLASARCVEGGAPSGAAILESDGNLMNSRLGLRAMISPGAGR